MNDQVVRRNRCEFQKDSTGGEVVTAASDPG